MKAKLAPAQQKLAARETKPAKSETSRDVGETDASAKPWGTIAGQEFLRTVAMRLMQIDELLGCSKYASHLHTARKRISDLVLFVTDAD